MKKTDRKEKYETTAYTLKFTPEMNEKFDLVLKKLGWGKAKTIRKNNELLEDAYRQMEAGRELEVTVRDSVTKQIYHQECFPFKALTN